MCGRASELRRIEAELGCLSPREREVFSRLMDGETSKEMARALLEVLRANADILDGQRLHREVAARVSFAADNVGFEQVPEYAPVRFAGHEAGEFFFVPRM